MVQERIGQRYAKAIMDLAVSRKVEGKVLEDMQLFRTICRENRDFVLMLKSPLIQNDKKGSIVRSVLAGKTDTLIIEAFDLIIRKNRANVLSVIGDEFVRMYQRLNNILEVKISSAAPLSEASRTQLLVHVEQLISVRYTQNGIKPVISLEEKTDSELIGGFVLKIGDLQYDGSFAETLRRLRQEFQSNPYIKN